MSVINNSLTSKDTCSDVCILRRLPTQLWSLQGARPEVVISKPRVETAIVTVAFRLRSYSCLPRNPSSSILDPVSNGKHFSYQRRHFKKMELESNLRLDKDSGRLYVLASNA